MAETTELPQVVRESESQASRVRTLARLGYQLSDPQPDGRDASPRSAVMTSPKPATATLMTATLGLAAASWLVAVRQMNGMDMGVATDLGSFQLFVAVWAPMMAAMMLPAAAPAVSRHARTSGRVRAAPLFVGSYLAVWTFVGAAVYAAYRPHGTTAAGVITIAAGVYELTPLKQHFRRRCRASVRSGLGFGVNCVGSSIGLMLMLVALGPMSVTWMSVVALLVLAQKLMPPRAFIDAPRAVTIIAIGILVIVAPSSIPGLTPAM
jgi:predicted metal-binding membrane protein